MTPTRLPRLPRLRGLAGLALASTVLLTGCGAVPDFNPGVAARVGDETVTLDHVDDVSTSYCSVVEPQLEAGQTVAQHILRGRVVGNLALRVAAEQFAAERGVTAGEDYDEAVARGREQFAQLSEDELQALIDVDAVALYVDAVVKSAGEAIIEEQGTTAQDEEEAAQAAGQQAFLTWLDDQDIRIDPRFGVTIEDGQVAPADTSVSFALGDTATLADAAEPDPAYAAGLPDAQRCG